MFVRVVANGNPTRPVRASPGPDNRAVQRIGSAPSSARSVDQMGESLRPRGACQMRLQAMSPPDSPYEFLAACRTNTNENRGNKSFRPYDCVYSFELKRAVQFNRRCSPHIYSVENKELSDTSKVRQAARPRARRPSSGRRSSCRIRGGRRAAGPATEHHPPLRRGRSRSVRVSYVMSYSISCIRRAKGNGAENLFFF